jgi:DNA topoisomerase VI subunit B
VADQFHQTEKKETKMDNKQQIFEAIDNILENNLNEMKENFSQVLQEKTMEKLEEKKKDIAANYFAQ